MCRTRCFLWAALLLAFPLSHAFECPSGCGVPHDVEFCEFIDWTSCPIRDVWPAGDVIARQRTEQAFFEALGDSTPANLTQISALNSECVRLMAELQCLIEFPPCEIGHEATSLCPSDCDEVQSACGTLLSEDFCHRLKQESYGIIVERKDRYLLPEDEKCIPLSYQGPAVGLWAIGFAIAVVFSMLSTIGLNMQKKSIVRNQRSSEPVPVWKQPLWLLGFSLIVSGSLLDFVAFGLAPQTLLAPLSALSLVWNLVAAPLYNGETVTRRNLIATVIIFMGVISVVIFSARATPSYTLKDLINLWKQPISVVYVVMVTTSLLSVYAIIKVIEGEKDTVFISKKQAKSMQRGIVHVVAYGALAGTFGGQSVLLAKSTIEMIKSAMFNGGDEFMHWQTYVFIVGMFLCLLSQLTFLNMALERFNALIMIPVYQSFWILSSILGGLMFFEEYTTMTLLQQVMFAVGCLITFSGIGVLLTEGFEGKDLGEDENTKLQELSAFLGEDEDAWDTSAMHDADSLNIESTIGHRSGHNSWKEEEGALPPHVQAKLNLLDKELDEFVL